MGGWKESGLGVRHGPAGLRKYTHQQALMVTRFAPKREIHYFPYNAKVTKAITRGIKLFYGATRSRRDCGRRPAGLRELVAQAPPRAVLERVDGVDRAAQPLGDLARREPGDQPQEHHLALIGRQRLERRPQVVEALVGVQLGDAGGGRDLGQRHGTLRSQVVERSVAGDAQEPGREGGGARRW